MRTKYHSYLSFGLIGIVNTALDIGAYLTLRVASVPIVVANIASTSLALTLSYFLNRRFTFNSAAKSRHTIVPFLLVTLTGLWLLQPLVIYIALSILDAPSVAQSLGHIGISSASRDLLSKLVATPASLVWNYVLYRRIVFRT